MPPWRSNPWPGRFASVLFGAGLLGAALLAASILPLSTAYSVSEFGYEAALDDSPREAPFFYGTYVLIVGIAVVVVLTRRRRPHPALSDPGAQRRPAPAIAGDDVEDRPRPDVMGGSSDRRTRAAQLAALALVVASATDWPLRQSSRPRSLRADPLASARQRGRCSAADRPRPSRRSGCSRRSCSRWTGQGIQKAIPLATELRAGRCPNRHRARRAGRRRQGGGPSSPPRTRSRLRSESRRTDLRRRDPD